MAQEAEAKLAGPALARVQRLSDEHAAPQAELERATAQRDVALAQIERTKAVIARETIRAPFRARVRELPVSVGSQVETGAPLIRLEPLADDGAGEQPPGAGAAAGIELPAEPGTVSPAQRAERAVEIHRHVVVLQPRRHLLDVGLARLGDRAGPVRRRRAGNLSPARASSIRETLEALHAHRARRGAG